ncbi:UbiA family prenyltransferase [Alteromonas portus]|uniref:UbiA family prenyltransferase n=1 Tax=Alteromonas portus TaxID=2565549 RepID=UPI003BF77F2F
MDSLNNGPIFVDLDGTFTKTDLLLESFLIAFKENPFIVVRCIIWLMISREMLKSKLSVLADIDPHTLPLNEKFYAYLMSEKKNGRQIYLATAANEKYAKSITKSFEIFDGYISSSDKVNLKGKKKLKRIKEMCNTFSYAGNEIVDFEIFKEAQESILVNPSPKVRKQSLNINIDKTFDYHQSSLKDWIRQARVHQWAKNLLIFVPLIVSGLFYKTDSISLAVMAFFAFSFLASATYILNDALDLESDRNHTRKRYRPLASGVIPIKEGMLGALALFVLSALISLFIGISFSTILVGYLILTLSYSFVIKQYIGMDVVCLALLYTVRILAGAAAIEVVVSYWLFAFSIFVFISLALVKRCSEIQSMQAEGKSRAKGRDYTIDDYSVLEGFGTSSAMLSVLMFCFYINNNALTDQYQQPDTLWLIVPALSYWLMRMWIKTRRGEMHDDPIVFSLKDKGSLTTIGFCCFIALLAQIL